MVRIAKQDKEDIMRQIYQGKIDAIAVSQSSLVDDIVLSMHQNGITDCIKNGFCDRRADNTTVPFDLTLHLAIAAKMKVHTSLSDIPYALTDHRTICQLGYSMYDTNRDIKTGLMSEGTIRALVGKYTHNDFIGGYISTVQNFIMPKMKISPHIHILDCTKIEVNYNNKNYEGSDVIRDEGKFKRGYKLATIRGLTANSGIIEDIRFASISQHDLSLSRNMLLESPVLKNGDILINDKGFLSREVINFLKVEREVDTYIPLRVNMNAFKFAVETAKDINKWESHPNKKRNQQITFVADIGKYWVGENPSYDVPVNACVVKDNSTNEYFVFVTTDTSKNAVQIIKTYELRPEIEEDYRQLKDFWKLEDFKSTKLNMILFHIVCVLLGYLFFQLYMMLPEGALYVGKCFPVILKNYCSVVSAHYVIYSNDKFGVLSLYEIVEIYSQCNEVMRKMLAPILKKV